MKLKSSMIPGLSLTLGAGRQRPCGSGQRIQQPVFMEKQKKFRKKIS